MKRYNPKELEPKWQKTWADSKIYNAVEGDSRPKYYALSFFPYPSGVGLHIGHTRNFTITDVVARAKRMQGYNVLQPMGWDSFGLPGENYAIKTGVAPQITTKQNTDNFRAQCKKLGLAIDWSREFGSSDPSYYQWTQWFFLLLLERGLAYQQESPQWWCETDKTVLANEQVEAGRCWRCGNLVIKKNLKQWFFKITDYADRLVADLDDLNWPEGIKTMQRNWIGKSTGAKVEFAVDVDLSSRDFLFLHAYQDNSKSVFLPWLKKDLESRGANVTALDLPNSANPDLKEQLEYVKDNYKFTSKTTIVCHSLGGVLALKLIPQLNASIDALILAGAPLRTDDFKDGKRRAPLDTYCDWQFDFAAVKEKVNTINVLSSSNDHVVPSSHGEKIAQELGANYQIIETFQPHFNGEVEPSLLSAVVPNIEVFTTRPDTLFGATFMVLAPEHPLVKTITTTGQKEAVEAYVAEASRKNEIERQEQAAKEKTGVFTGAYAINPVNGKQIPVWVADYVLMGYGTGAIMAVPAHDERDNAFAKKYDLPIVEVIEPETGIPQQDPEFRKSIVAIVRNPKDNTYLSVNWGKLGGNLFIGGGREDDEDIIACAEREVAEETGYSNIKFVAQTGKIHHHYYAYSKKKARIIEAYGLLFDLVDDTQQEQHLEANEQGKFTVQWLSQNDAEAKVTETLHASVYNLLVKGECYSGEGIMVNSGDYDGMSSSEAREKIVADLQKQGKGSEQVNYKIRDWLISRQRYWGAPIPIIHCPNDGIVPVPKDQLPLELPILENFQPSGDGKSPLANAADWVNTTCPKCGSPAERETDTMDGFACSSWYFLRFADPHNTKEPFAKDKADYWLPVDMYVGGAEHAVMHLLYARMWTKVMADAGLINFTEPFKALRNQGMLLAADGEKISKSKGNSISPEDIIDQGYGADALRMIVLFLAPFDMATPWSNEGLAGVFRFLQRVWTITQRYLESDNQDQNAQAQTALMAATHTAIKKVSKDVEAMGYNTAIAALMQFTNELYVAEKQYGFASKDGWQFALTTLTQLLAPFAPHITEELWADLGNKDSVHVSNWPVHDDSYLVQDVLTIAIQVNGKLRGEIQVSQGATQELIEQEARAQQNVASYLSGDVRKVIYVPNRLINFVV